MVALWWPVLNAAPNNPASAGAFRQHLAPMARAPISVAVSAQFRQLGDVGVMRSVSSGMNSFTPATAPTPVLLHPCRTALPASARAAPLRADIVSYGTFGRSEFSAT